MGIRYTCTTLLLKALTVQVDVKPTVMQSWPGLTLGGVGPIVLCKTCSVLLCVLEQLRVDNSSNGPLRGYHTLQGDNSLNSVVRFVHMMFVCRFQASR